ncbi:MAG: transcription elongation factor GreA [Candidatus Delongbacteria bacterium]|nr:transcription elongation factor GreA [Candidatus Delongbacteria bacterium]MCG2760241.1 transcription elongation factor GreA [Candidatus Delongbacteria bacterium]
MNYLTEDGMKKIVEKLYNLKHIERNAILKRVNEARKLGDLRENGDFKAAKEDLTRIDIRIAELETYIADSQIIIKSKTKDKFIRILSKVRIKDHTRNKELEYTLVSQAEADPAEGKISADSPIGKGLLGKKAGAKFTIKIPIGDIEVEVIEIISDN